MPDDTSPATPRPADNDTTDNDTTDAGGDRYAGFPAGFFSRMDESSDAAFYVEPRLVTHIDDDAIEAVRTCYDELGMHGEILDLCSSWTSHLARRPQRLVVVGMNDEELARNELAHERLVHDLNQQPELPFGDGGFDGAICTVSVDYLIRPVEVFDEVARVLRPGAPFACTFSNRCFPTKVIRGWTAGDDDFHLQLVAEYFRRSQGWEQPRMEHRNPGRRGDPLFVVWARTDR